LFGSVIHGTRRAPRFVAIYKEDGVAKLNELLLAEYDREVERSRKALEQMPDGKKEWKPHESSMAFGYLCEMVATIPTWIAMTIQLAEWDIAPKDGPKMKREALNSAEDYRKAHQKATADGRKAIEGVSDEHLQKPWKLLVGGNVVLEMSRYDMVCDTLNHLAHHRGQMTVYLRLLGAKVPALYGPSADEKNF
jgi:uncharacterized damage-inducible protein DinB